jgi:glycosyltransferase involved in cell wall biosynthesis
MKLRICILGTRGIPNNYGGFEQVASYLSKGLVERGHEVTVYNSHKHPYQQNEWHGVKIIHCYDPEHIIGTAGQFVYDFNCITDANKRKFDVMLMLGYTSSSVWGKIYSKYSACITNMDGLEWKRSKYSKPVQTFLKHAEKLAIKYSDFHIADSPVIKNYLDEKYGITSKYIAYGAEIFSGTDKQALADHKISKKNYYLLMARMEPENNIDTILNGFCHSGSDKPFVVVGNTDTKYGTHLVKKFKTEGDVRFLGGIFNDVKVKSLINSSAMYFHGHSVGGTNPSLLEAMGSDALIAAHDNQFNRAVLNNDAYYFSTSRHVKEIIEGANGSEIRQEQMIENNRLKISKTYSCESMVEAYENFFIECIEKKRR